MRGLQGKNVLITGGSSGIGQAIAVRFAEYGANVAINYLTTPDEAVGTEEQVHACVKRVRQQDVKDVLVQGDVSREEDVVRMVEQTVSELGSLDVLVNNAGIQISRPSHELSQADFEKVLGVNLRGAFLCAREAIKRFLDAGHGGRDGRRHLLPRERRRRLHHRPDRLRRRWVDAVRGLPRALVFGVTASA